MFQLRPGDGIHISSSVSRAGPLLFPGLEAAVSKLEAEARSALFRDGRLRLRCLATMFTLYRKSDETEITEDTPKLALVVGPTQPHATYQAGGKTFLISSAVKIDFHSEHKLINIVCYVTLKFGLHISLQHTNYIIIYL